MSLKNSSLLFNLVEFESHSSALLEHNQHIHTNNSFTPSTTTTTITSNYNNQSGVELYLIILASIFYSISIVLGVGGNTLVLLVVIYYQRMRTVTNFFIFNLAISDLIFAVLCIPTTYITAYLIQYWPFSSFLCVFFNYMQNVSVTLTVYTLIWITLDKYWALVMPLKLRMSIKVCKYLIVLTWLFSLFISLPIALYTQLVYPNNTLINNNNNNTNNVNKTDEFNKPQCSEKWPDKFSNYTQIYNFFLLFVQYLLPLIILTFCYAAIGIVLRRTKAPGESIQNRDAKMLQSKKKMIKMCFFMVLTFMISWAPMQIITVYRFYDNDQITYLSYFGDLFFVCHLIAVSRSFVNPFIYAWTNARFREGFKYFLCFSCLSPKRKNYAQSELLRLAYKNTHNVHMVKFNDSKSNTKQILTYKTSIRENKEEEEDVEVKKLFDKLTHQRKSDGLLHK